jgi:dolichol-phosphate mannosyltransferase
MQNKISIILPTYNESKNIIPLVEQIVAELATADYEIIVVDDNSPDGTSNIVQQATSRFPNLRLLTRNSDKGLVNSIRDGIKASHEGSICIWMDADMSMSPSLITSFVKEIELGADLVIGSRYIPGGGIKGMDLYSEKTSLYKIWKNLSTSEDSFLSAMISKWGNKMIGFILNSPLHDYSSGYYAGRKETFDLIKIEGYFVDYCLSLSYRAYMKGMSVKEVPMFLLPRKYGQSKTSNSLFSILHVGYQCFKSAFILRATIKNERGNHETV